MAVSGGSSSRGAITKKTKKRRRSKKDGVRYAKWKKKQADEAVAANSRPVADMRDNDA